MFLQARRRFLEEWRGGNHTGRPKKIGPPKINHKIPRRVYCSSQNFTSCILSSNPTPTPQNFWIPFSDVVPKK